MIFLLENRLRIRDVEIPFEHVDRSRYRIRLSFKDSGTLLIETQTGIGEFEKNFISEKKRWILNTHKRFQREVSERSTLLKNLDTFVPLLGIDVPVEYLQGPKTRFRYEKNQKLIITAPHPYFLTHRKQLVAVAGRKLASVYLDIHMKKWADITEMNYNQLKIKDHSSKWGSCSVERNINLNWYLIWLEEKLIDYVIVHELMHLHEMNHGPRFWKWVEKYIPDYVERKKLIDQRQWVIGVLK